jgi:flagellar motor component MotA
LDADLLYIDTLIKGRARAVRTYYSWAIALPTLGIVIIVAALVPHSVLVIPDVMRTFLGIGGAFIATLTGVPLKEILNQTERKEIYQGFRQVLSQAATEADLAERTRVREAVWGAIGKIAQGG